MLLMRACSQGFWSVAPGNSYWGAFLRDAGADYRFAASSVSAPAVAPAAFEREFGQAQIWLNALFYSYSGTKQVWQHRFFIDAYF